MKTALCCVVLACSVFVMVNLPAWADYKNDKPALSGVWTSKEGETKVQFSDKNVMKIFPHGDNKAIVVVCEYAAEKEGLVKAKTTDIEGTDEVKKLVQEMLPLSTKFSFTWKVKDDTAKLDDVKGDKVDVLKAHLEGEYNKK
jgi:hypothetical protein